VQRILDCEQLTALIGACLPLPDHATTGNVNSVLWINEVTPPLRHLKVKDTFRDVSSENTVGVARALRSTG